MKYLMSGYSTRKLPMPSSQATARARVVLADDDEDWRSLLTAVLEGAGYEVEQAADGLELRTILETAESTGRSPDVVVSDHGMPHLTGLQVLRWASDHAHPVPFILLSAFAGPYIREPAFELGAAAVFDKPVDPAQLQTQIAQILVKNSKS